MKFFEQAQENYRRSNFFKSLEFFELSLKEEPLSTEMKLLCCEKIEKINQILNQQTSPELLDFLAKNYFELSNYERAYDFYKKLFNETKNIKYKRLEFDSLKKSGDVLNSIVVARSYLEELLKLKITNTTLDFLKELESSLKKEEISLWTLRTVIISGDTTKLASEIELWGEYRDKELTELLEAFFDLTNHNSKYWHSNDNLVQLVWSYLQDEDIKPIVSKKRIVKFIIDFWLTQEKEPGLLTETMNLAKKFELNLVGHELAKFSGDTKMIDYFLDRTSRDAFFIENYDFGEDLFHSDQNDSAEKIIRDINFLVKSGRKAEAIKLAYELERIEPDHQLVKKLLSNNSTVDESVREKRVAGLFKELQKYTSNKSNEIDETSEYIKLVRYYDNEYIQKNYEDMIIGFNLLNLHKVSIKIAERVNTEIFTQREIVNFNYLLAETLYLDKQYYLLRDLCEDTLSNIPLLKEEQPAFIYLRAESYFHLGYLEYALAIFKGLKKKHPNYRLSEQRIEAIEANK